MSRAERHYIGLDGDEHVRLTTTRDGTRRVDRLHREDDEPIVLDGVGFFPVSADVFAAWRPTVNSELIVGARPCPLCSRPGEHRTGCAAGPPPEGLREAMTLAAHPDSGTTGGGA